MNALQLTEAGLKLKSSTLPELTSSKLFGIDPSEEEKQRFNQVLDNYNEILHEERVCHKKTLSVARWDDTLNLAVVEQVKGTNPVKFTFQNKDGIFLNPEDALFLMDQNLLELFYQDVPLSLHEAYMLLVPLLPSYEYYEVFAYLCRLGYVVKRHKALTQQQQPQQVDEQQHGLEEAEENSESKWGKGLGSPAKDDIIIDESPDTQETAEPMSSGYVKNLWTEYPDVQPCIRPGEAFSTAAVLSKLKVMEMFRMNDIKFPETDSSPSHRIDFDVFLSIKARKKCESRPRFRVIVCKYDDSPPTLSTVARLTQESHGVSLKLAVVNDGTVLFYGMFGVDLPNLITVG